MIIIMYDIKFINVKWLTSYIKFDYRIEFNVAKSINIINVKVCEDGWRSTR